MEIQYLNQKDLYSTFEFPIAVCLVYFGYKLEALEKDPKSPQRVIFHFQRTPELDKTLQAYWEDSLRVSPKRWHALSRELKSRIRSELIYEINQ